jgi:hypothetical protein
MIVRSAIRFDRSAQTLLLSNLFTIVLALVQRWNLSELLWIYWGQSMVIGFFNWKRIGKLRDFSTDGFLVDNKPIEPTPETRRSLAKFFALHFGAFHVFYLIFLLLQHHSISWINLAGIVVAVGVFGCNHGFSFSRNLEKDLLRKPHIQYVMFFPYARIVPMHIIMIFGSLFMDHMSLMLVFFLLLKTASDVIMHMIEHHQTVQAESD